MASMSESDRMVAWVSVNLQLCFSCLVAGVRIDAKYLMTRHCACPREDHDTIALCGVCVELIAVMIASTGFQNCGSCGEEVVGNEPQLLPTRNKEATDG